jgi:AAA family ATP:ADP antiporter
MNRLLARALRPFGRVEPEESVGAVVLGFCAFLLLTAYYLLKTAREPLILLHGGAEVKSYASAGQAMILLVVVHAYSALAKRVGRMQLLATVHLIFGFHLAVFALLARAGVAIGVPFFLWVGVFNYTAIAQFWAFAADVYTPEQGRRLFAILGIGSSVGAVAGARIAEAMAPLGPSIMMLTAATILVACIGLYALGSRVAASPRRSASRAETNEPLTDEGPFQLLRRDRYLLLIAGLTVLLNWCNANGEYLLDRTLLASVGEAQARGVAPDAFIGSFKAQYFAWFNAAGVAIQLFAVSRVMTRLGVRNALLVLPAVAFLGYGMVLVAPLLALVRIAKVAENSLDYSLQNTARQALYLVTSRPEKYVGKTLVDTFLVRAGDALSAIGVWAAMQVGVSTSGLAALNLVLIALWIGVVMRLGREHTRRATETEEQIAAEPGALPKPFIAGILVLVAMLAAARADAADPPKRPLPDYAGRKPPPTTVGDVAVWLPSATVGIAPRRWTHAPQA